MSRSWVFGSLVVCLCCPAPAAAQEAPTFRAGQIVVSGGAMLVGGYPIGDLTVSIPRNGPGAQAPLPILRAQSRIERAGAVEARVAVGIARVLGIEVGGTYSKPQLGVTVSQDPELSGGAVVTEQLDQFGVDVSGIYQLPISLGRSARPYAIGGGGYLRQLHEGRLLVETGQTFHLGGGLQYWLRSSPRGRAMGIRGEVRFVRRTGAIDFEDQARGFASGSILGFFGF